MPDVRSGGDYVIRGGDYVKRAMDLFILGAWILCCGVAISLAVFSPFRDVALVSLFAGMGAGWYWRSRKL